MPSVSFLCSVACLAAALPLTALAVTYAYDGQGRLAVVNTDDSKQTAYSLDAAGNRTQVQTATGSAALPTASNFTKNVPSQSPVSINITSHGSGGTGTISLVGVGTPQFGTISGQTLAGVTYTPNAHHPAGPDTISYSLRDTPHHTASALVTFNLLLAN